MDLQLGVVDEQSPAFDRPLQSFHSEAAAHASPSAGGMDSSRPHQNEQEDGVGSSKSEEAPSFSREESDGDDVSGDRSAGQMSEPNLHTDDAAAMKGCASFSSAEETYASLSESLLEGIVRAANPSAERANVVLAALRHESENGKPITIAVLERTKVGRVLAKTIKACKRHALACEDGDEEGWGAAISAAEDLRKHFMRVYEEEFTPKNKLNENNDAVPEGDGSIDEEMRAE